MPTIDPVTPEFLPPSRAHAAWTAMRPHLVIVVVIIVTWGLPIVTSMSQWLGLDGLTVDSPPTVAGLWLREITTATTALLLAALLAGRRAIGLTWAGGEEKTERRTVIWCAVAAVFAAMMTRSILAALGLPLSLPSMAPDVDPLRVLALGSAAGLAEEIPMATMTLLMLRARWPVYAIYTTIVTLRIAYHMYQGAAVALPVALWSSVFLWLFLRYRNVAALVAVHTFLNVGSWLRGFVLVPALEGLK